VLVHVSVLRVFKRSMDVEARLWRRVLGRVDEAYAARVLSSLACYAARVLSSLACAQERLRLARDGTSR